MAGKAEINGAQVDLDLAERILQAEAGRIAELGRKLRGELAGPFTQAARAIFACRGQVVLTGIGKAGIIGRKISATLASTGTRSIFLHPVEALHGDLGRVQRGDVVIALSHSGQTEELVRLMDHIKARGAELIAVTGGADSPLAGHADIAICYGDVEEACPLGLVPTVSTSCMLSLGDALALTVMQMRRLKPEDFAAFHPAGSLGRRLLTVEQAMWFRKDENLALVSDRLSLAEALGESEKCDRRTGVMMLVDEAGRLSGILTDADLRRLLVAEPDGKVLGRPVAEFMTRNPTCVRLGDLASEALAIMNQRRFDELPVLDGDGRPVGVIDVQDLVGIKTVNNE